MDELKHLDKVAYVRFASVYRHFRDIGEFMTELEGPPQRERMTERRPAPRLRVRWPAAPAQRAPREREPSATTHASSSSAFSCCSPALAGLLTLARARRAWPRLLTEFVLYALSATNLTILVALVFVLAPTSSSSSSERRRGLPFARFRSKLVAVLLGNDESCRRARAARRRGSDPQQRGSLVQRADERRALVGQPIAVTTTRSRNARLDAGAAVRGRSRRWT